MSYFDHTPSETDSPAVQTQRRIHPEVRSELNFLVNTGQNGGIIEIRVPDEDCRRAVIEHLRLLSKRRNRHLSFIVPVVCGMAFRKGNSSLNGEDHH